MHNCCVPIVITMTIVIVTVIATVLILLPIPWDGVCNVRGIDTLHHAVLTLAKKRTLHPAMLLAYMRVCDSVGLISWAAEGTALGLVRDGRLIPWDNDIDVGIWKEDNLLFRKKVLPLLTTQEGFRLIGTRTNCYRLTWHGTLLEVSVLARDEPCMAIAYPRHCNELLPFQAVDQLRAVPFMDRPIRVPPDAYLVTLYGADWRTPKKQFRPSDRDAFGDGKEIKDSRARGKFYRAVGAN